MSDEGAHFFMSKVVSEDGLFESFGFEDEEGRSILTPANNLLIVSVLTRRKEYL